MLPLATRGGSIAYHPKRRPVPPAGVAETVILCRRRHKSIRGYSADRTTPGQDAPRTRTGTTQPDCCTSSILTTAATPAITPPTGCPCWYRGAGGDHPADRGSPGCRQRRRTKTVILMPASMPSWPDRSGRHAQVIVGPDSTTGPDAPSRTPSVPCPSTSTVFGCTGTLPLVTRSFPSPPVLGRVPRRRARPTDERVVQRQGCCRRMSEPETSPSGITVPEVLDAECLGCREICR